MGDGAPGPGEFDSWLKPCDALERLPADWGRGHSINAVITNLKVGAIRACGRAGRLDMSGGLKHVSFYLLPPIYWDELAWINGPEALWVTGQISFHIGSRTGNADPADWIEHIFTDVRLDPGEFAIAFGEVEPQRDVVDERSTRSILPQLATAEAKRFLTAYLNVFGSEVAEAKALAALRASYADHSMSRDQFREILRELRGAGKRGKPPIRG